VKANDDSEQARRGAPEERHEGTAKGRMSSCSFIFILLIVTVVIELFAVSAVRCALLAWNSLALT